MTNKIFAKVSENSVNGKKLEEHYFEDLKQIARFATIIICRIMEATINVNNVWNLFSSLDFDLKKSFAKELNDLLSRYKKENENEKAAQSKLTEDEFTMQLLEDCYGALECWDDDFVNEIKESEAFKTRDEKLIELFESNE